MHSSARRSLSAALKTAELTPEAQAFLKGGSPKPLAEAPSIQAVPTQPAVALVSEEQEELAPPEPQKRARARGIVQDDEAPVPTPNLVFTSPGLALGTLASSLAFAAARSCAGPQCLSGLWSGRPTRPCSPPSSACPSRSQNNATPRPRTRWLFPGGVRAASFCSGYDARSCASGPPPNWPPLLPPPMLVSPLVVRVPRPGLALKLTVTVELMDFSA